MANLLVSSMDAPDDLNNSQADSFILATFLFDTLAPGDGTLSLVRLVLADAVGAPLAADIQFGRITVATANAVPAPSSLALLVAEVCMLMLCNQKIMRLTRRFESR